MVAKQSLVLALVGLIALAGSAIGMAASQDPANLTRRAVVPGVERGEEFPTPTPAPTPTPRPAPYAGPVTALYLPSANINGNAPVEQRGTRFEGSREVFQDPSAPGDIAWYVDPRFGHPGFGGQNSVFAAHINYVGYGNGPFAHLANAQIGGGLYLTMADGTQYGYTIISVDMLRVEDLDNGGMDRIIFPPLDANTERVTLISCGGDFVPFPGGGGEYTSRIVVSAERAVN